MMAGVFQMWKELQMWVALGRELDWRKTAPCRESEPGVSPPRLQHQPAMLLPPSSPQPAPFFSGDLFFFSLWGSRWRQMVYRRKRRRPCFRGRSPQPAMGRRAPASPKYPLPSQARHHGFTRGSLQSSVLPRSVLRVPSFPADPPFPSPAFPQNPCPAPGLTEGGGTGLPSEQRWGPSPKTRLGGPQAP